MSSLSEASAERAGARRTQDVRPQDFFPVPLGVMQPGTVAPVDLYIRFGQSQPFVLYKGQGAELREEVRERLLENGVDSLYLAKSDESAYHRYVEENISTIIRDDLVPREEASRMVYGCSSRVMEDVFREPRSGRNMRRAHSMVEATVQSILKDPECLWHMTAVASHDYYTYTHCVHVGMFMTAASRDMLGVDDPGMLRAIGLGGMLHDIGKSQIPESILNKPGRLTDEEFRAIKRHPTIGLSLLEHQPHLLAATVDIVRHHHERYNGGGYPRGLTGEGISDLARLSTIVDVYDALTTNRAYAEAREPYTALEMMLHEMEGHFDGPMLQAFVKFLGPREFREQMRQQWNEVMGQSTGVKITG